MDNISVNICYCIFFCYLPERDEGFKKNSKKEKSVHDTYPVSIIKLQSHGSDHGGP